MKKNSQFITRYIRLKLRFFSGVSLISYMVFTTIYLQLTSCNPKILNGLRKNDLTRDVQMITDHGTIIIRLSDSTPLHRNNFLSLVKQHFYDGIVFHRIIQNFMIQAGDPRNRTQKPGDRMDTSKQHKTIPAEFVASLFHKKGVIAAARQGDDVNPLKASSGSQFYIVQGKIFTEAGLDSLEVFRLAGKKLPLAHRDVYKSLGGTPHLDGNYTVYGELIKGLDVVDKVASAPTNGSQGGNKPLKKVRIIKAKLVRRKHE